MPYLDEVAFAVCPESEGRQCLLGINGSPKLRTPFDGFESLLATLRAEEESPVLVFGHVFMPITPYRDTGKTSVILDRDHQEALDKAITKVLADWTREQKRLERNQRILDRPPPKTAKTKLNDAIYLEMPNGIDEVSGGGRFDVPAKNLHYAIRRLIQKHTDETLTLKYFNTVLKQWQLDHGPILNLYRDPRGVLIEPHTNQIIPLGTKQAESYQVPAWLYDKVLFIEKKGFGDILAKSQIAARFDVAIIASEGYAVDAAKMMSTTIQLDPGEMRPLIELVVREVLGLLDWPAGRVALSEEEAARALGVPRHVLRDARLAGELHGRRVGKRIVYTRQDLAAYLDRQRDGRR